MFKSYFLLSEQEGLVEEFKKGVNGINLPMTIRTVNNPLVNFFSNVNMTEHTLLFKYWFELVLYKTVDNTDATNVLYNPALISSDIYDIVYDDETTTEIIENMHEIIAVIYTILADNYFLLLQGNLLFNGWVVEPFSTVGVNNYDFYTIEKV